MLKILRFGSSRIVWKRIPLGESVQLNTIIHVGIASSWNIHFDDNFVVCGKEFVSCHFGEFFCEGPTFVWSGQFLYRTVYVGIVHGISSSGMYAIERHKISWKRGRGAYETWIHSRIFVTRIQTLIFAQCIIMQSSALSLSALPNSPNSVRISSDAEL